MQALIMLSLLKKLDKLRERKGATGSGTDFYRLND